MIFQTSLLVGYVSIPWRVSAIDLDVSENSGTPKSSILRGFFHYFHHAFWEIPYFRKHPYGDYNKQL